MKRLLAAVDFSPGSLAAFEYATLFGEAFGSTVDALHVWQTNTVTRVTGARLEAKEALREFVARSAVHRPAALRRRVEYGDPYMTILGLSKMSKHNAIFVGARGKSDAESRRLGHVPLSLLPTAPCAVVVVPLAGSERATAMKAPRRVYVANSDAPHLSGFAAELCTAFAASMKSLEPDTRVDPADVVVTDYAALEKGIGAENAPRLAPCPIIVVPLLLTA
ncbi:MAG TPA: universal stress protein [Polyangiaceae bacterium]|nr:universal stress protein [Polyangiaceae bacterium]